MDEIAVAHRSTLAVYPRSQVPALLLFHQTPVSSHPHHGATEIQLPSIGGRAQVVAAKRRDEERAVDAVRV